LSFGFIDGNSVYRVSGAITSLTYVVLEPGALALLGLRAGLLAVRRRA
jgi:hypothetical protein